MVSKEYDSRLFNGGRPRIPLLVQTLHSCIIRMMEWMNTAKYGFFHNFSTSAWSSGKNGRLMVGGAIMA